MPPMILLIIIFGVGLFLLMFLIIKGIFAPKKVQYLQSLVNQRRFPMAIKVGKRMVTKDPRNTAAHYLLGKAYKGDNNPDMAMVEFKSVNMIGSFNEICQEGEFRKEMADLYVKHNQVEEALKEYLLLSKIQPNNADHFYQIGLLFEQRERSDMAGGYYQKALGLDPRHSDAHFRLGFLMYRKKKNLEAKAEFEAAIKLNDTNYNAHFYLGRIKKDGRDFTGALLHFDKAQKEAELKVKAIVEKGACYLSVNNLEKAVLELNRAIKLSEDEGASETLYARYFLAHCYEKARKIELAVEQWEKIYAKKPSFRDVAEKLSQYQELRQDDSVKDFLTSNREAFHQICGGVVTHGLKLSVREAQDIANGCEIIAIESESKWRNARKMPRLVRFFRIPEMIKDTTIRNMHEDMKKMNVTRGIVFTSSSYSRTAVEFAESRPIDLYDKDQLREFLIKASEKEKAKG